MRAFETAARDIVCGAARCAVAMRTVGLLLDRIVVLRGTFGARAAARALGLERRARSAPAWFGAEKQRHARARTLRLAVPIRRYDIRKRSRGRGFRNRGVLHAAVIGYEFGGGTPAAAGLSGRL
jgi:hypothetical protein